jgi:hypothetical protein
MNVHYQCIPAAPMKWSQTVIEKVQKRIAQNELDFLLIKYNNSTDQTQNNNPLD